MTKRHCLLISFVIAVTKFLSRSNLKEKEFILAYKFGSWSYDICSQKAELKGSRSKGNKNIEKPLSPRLDRSNSLLWRKEPC